VSLLPGNFCDERNNGDARVMTTVRSWQAGVTRPPRGPAIAPGMDATVWTTFRSRLPSLCHRRMGGPGRGARVDYGAIIRLPSRPAEDSPVVGHVVVPRGRGKILALTETMIRLENTRGTRQSIYRPGFSGCDFIVPVWDLGRKETPAPQTTLY
jgi:hypothetical protein